MMNTFSDRVRENNNLFWEDAREYYLNDFFGSAYIGAKKEIIKKWLGKSDLKTILIRQIDTAYRPDFISDFLLICLRPDGFEMRMVEIGNEIAADVELNATHEAIVTATTNMGDVIFAIISKKIRLPKLWRNLRDHYYAAKLFFF